VPLTSNYVAVRTALNHKGSKAAVKNFTKILQNATEAIQQQYFMAEMAGGRSAYRERVYCYELYHQLRAIWPKHTCCVLNGELDKRSHPILQTIGISSVKPDLLVHKQGSMHHNYCAVEVKCEGAKNIDIHKDLNTLYLLYKRAAYRRVVYLLFGYDLASTLSRVRNIARAWPEPLDIELWIHAEPGAPAQQIQNLT